MGRRTPQPEQFTLIIGAGHDNDTGACHLLSVGPIFGISEAQAALAAVPANLDARAEPLRGYKETWVLLYADPDTHATTALGLYHSQPAARAAHSGICAAADLVDGELNPDPADTACGCAIKRVEWSLTRRPTAKPATT